MNKDAQIATLSGRLEMAELEHERLATENAALREALAFYADGWEGHPGDSGPGGNTPADPESWPSEDLLDDAGGIARQALAATEPEASCVREPYPPVCMTSTPAGNPGGGCTWPDCSCMPRGQYAEMILEHAEEVVRQAHSTKGKADDVS